MHDEEATEIVKHERCLNRSTRGTVTGAIISLAAVFLTTAVDADDAGYSVLLIGNSHSSRGNLPGVLQQLLESGSGASANVKAVGNWSFLAERLDDRKTQETLESRRWTHVVLQAQKYSTSGRYSYPTEAAEEWIRRSRSVGAQPILFPEWARLDNDEEAGRIHRLHMGIAAREPACVAPIGLAWEILLHASPDIRLHERDGNHANRTGALLTAYVLYAAITGNSVRELSERRIRGVPADTQERLRSAAEQAVSLAPPCDPYTVQ
jgi:hypothetical protein